MSDSFATPCIIARQASLSMRFFRQEYWSGLPFSPPGVFPAQESNPSLLHWQTVSLPLSHWGRPDLGIGQCDREEWIISVERVPPADFLPILIIFNVYTSLLYCLSQKGSLYTKLLLLNSFKSEKVRHKLNYSICY